MGRRVQGMVGLACVIGGTIAALNGCGASGGTGSSVAALGGPPSSFRSYNVPTFTTPNSTDCTTLRGQTATSKRPMCANTVYNSATDVCLIAGPRQGVSCNCYEGQAHACTPPTGSTPCPSGTGCGIRPCLVVSDTAAVWSTTCYALQ